MKIKRITPLHVVDAIEPLLELWRDRLGFVVVVEVPEGERIGFVLLAKDEQHVMLQTRASLANDFAPVATLSPDSFLYIDVDSLDACIESMTGSNTGASMLGAPRTTFYGAREAFFRLPSGHIIAYAEPQ